MDGLEMSIRERIEHLERNIVQDKALCHDLEHRENDTLGGATSIYVDLLYTRIETSYVRLDELKRLLR